MIAKVGKMGKGDQIKSNKQTHNKEEMLLKIF